MLGNVIMDKTSALGFRIPDEMKAALVAAAKGDDRSVSSLVTIILRDWLIMNRYLSEKFEEN
jgi:hypothetical protein